MVKGSQELVSALNTLPDRVRKEIESSMEKAANLLLDRMKELTPYDPESKHKHMRDGLKVMKDEEGTDVVYHVGLPTFQDTSSFYWFRFVDLGVKAQEVKYRKRGSIKLHYMQVPHRRPLLIRERAMDLVDADVQRLIGEAVNRALKKG